jgi:AraC-like DNA-binding protein
MSIKPGPRGGCVQRTENQHPGPKLQLARSLVVSDPGDVRIGPVLAIPDVLVELGASPRRVFAAAGVDVGLFRDPDSRIGFEDLGRLLGSCVEATKNDAFGLLVGERFDLTALGPIGQLMENSPTVGEALRSLVLHLHLHDRGAAPVLLAPEASSVILGYSIYRHATPAATQIYAAAVAIGFKILRGLCGAPWKPTRVQFSHARPVNIAKYTRMLGSEVWFETDVSGIVFASSWLQRPIPGADAALFADIEEAVREAEASGPTAFPDQVQGVLHQMVLSGSASSGAVARLFGVPERTLRRRLRDAGKSLRTLVSEARFELACQLLQNTGLSIAEIAGALQYNDANAFSRAFSNWAHVSPTRWRAKAALQPEN